MRGVRSAFVLAAAAMSFVAMSAAADVKEGVSAQKISLPSGPGSIEGLGESFEPQLNTGTATFAVGFAVPPGRVGHEPSLGLSYNAGSPSGCVGLGWSLSGVDFVQRQSDKGLPEYDDARDGYITRSGEELVRLSDGTFRAENESAFRQYSYDPAANVWTAGTRDGDLLTFGEVDAAACPGTTPRIESGSRTFRWMLTRATDSNGNRIDYCYTSFPDSRNAVYPAEVVYTRNAAMTFASEHRIVLSYSADRPDPVSDFRPGFELTWSRRLQRVDVCTAGGSFEPESACPGGAGARVRAYVLRYEDEGPAPCPACIGAYRASRLASVTQLGADGTSALPSVSFAYTDLDLASAPGWGTISGFPVAAFLTANASVVDLDADGLPDVLETPSDVLGFYNRWRNKGPAAGGTVRFTPVAERFAAPRRLLESRGTQIADLDGDGVADLVAEDVVNGEFELYRGTGRGGFDTAATAFTIGGFNNFFGDEGFENAEIRLSDLDFDKRIDVLRTIVSAPGEATALWVRFNRRDDEGGGTLTPTTSCAPVREADFAHGLTSLVDLNGDRLLDLTVLRPSLAGDDIEIRYFPSSGQGRFGVSRDDRPACTEAQGNPIVLGGDPVRLPSGPIDDKRLFWEDVTADGLADLLWVGRTSLVLWVNQGGEELVRVLASLPAYPAGMDVDLGAAEPSENDAVQFADVNGNGTSDVLVVDRESRRAHFLDFAGPEGMPAHLLREIDNGLGAVTTVDYASTSVLAQRAVEAERPWRTRVPFPTAVVTRTTVRTQGAPGGGGHDPATDGIVTEFRYRDGFYDGREKEFRGFSESTVIARGNADQPTAVTRRSFHTGTPDGIDNDGDGLVDERDWLVGAEEEPLKGMLLEVRQETCIDGDEGGCAGAGEVFDHGLSRWEIQTLYGKGSGSCSFDPDRACCSDADCSGAGVCEGAGASGDPSALFDTVFTCDPLRGRDVRFARTVAERKAVVERGNEPRVDLLTTRAYDGFGNIVDATNWGRVTAAGPPAFGCLLTTGICEASGDACGRDADCRFAPFETCQKESSADAVTCDADPLATLATAFPADPASADLPGDERSVQRTYATNATRWMVDRVREESILDGAGTVEATTRYAYDDLPLGQATRGNPTLQEEALIQESRFLPRARMVYDLFGNVVESLDARDNRRTYAFEAAFRTHPISETVHLDGYTIGMTAAYHEGFGAFTENTTWAVTGEGPLYEYHYDTFARPVAEVHPGDSTAAPTESYEYHLNEAGDGINFVTTHRRETVGGGTIDSFAYVDGLGRALGTKEEGDAPAEWIYTGATAFNRRGMEFATWLPYYVASSDYEAPDPAFAKTSTVYDAVGREVRSTHPDGDYREAVYAPLTTHAHDENDTAGVTPGAFTTLVEDGLERLSSVTERNAGEEYFTRYLYDARGNLTQVIDSQENEKYLIYDSLSRRIFMNDPDRGHMTYVYDDTDNVVETLDAKNQRIIYTYGRANRLATENYLDTTGDPETDPIDVTYIYDRPAVDVDMGDGTRETAAFTAGYLASVFDLSGEEHTSYDARRRTAWQVKRVRDTQTGVLTSYATRYTYDSLNRMALLRYPDGDRLRYGYGSRGLLTSLQGNNSGAMIIGDIDYRPSAQIARCAYGNGVVTTYEYDDRQRLTRLLTEGAGPTQDQDLIHYWYDFDPHSNIVQITDARGHVPPGDPRHNTQAFEYDDLHRLAAYSLTAPSDPAADYGSIAFTYDRIGNMRSKQSTITHRVDGHSVTGLGAMFYGGGPGGASGRKGRDPGDPPGPHALTATQSESDTRSFPYDANGNMVLIDDLQLTWDFKDRLVAAENGEMQAEYVYDYAARRIVKQVTPKTTAAEVAAGRLPTTTRYVNKYFEIRHQGQPVKYSFQGDTRVVRITGSLDPLAERVQSLQIAEGWNLLTLAVQASDAAAQLGIGSSPAISHAFRWRPTTRDYDELTADSPLPAGSVVWLRAAAPLTLQVLGTYTEPSSSPVAAGGIFLPVPGLQALNLDQALPPQVEQAWIFDADYQVWRSRFTGDLDFLSKAPNAMSPGDAIYVQASRPSQLKLPDAAAQIRYYHQDHLGSSSVIADSNGALVEDVAFYPFGHPRNEFRPSASSGTEPYKFTQKEIDAESRLQYFEARYLAGPLGRFLTRDPILHATSANGKLALPQSLHSYAYARNNPLRHIDPYGLQEEAPPSAEIEVKFGEEVRIGFELMGIGGQMRYSGMETPLKASTAEGLVNQDLPESQSAGVTIGPVNVDVTATGTAYGTMRMRFKFKLGPLKALDIAWGGGKNVEMSVGLEASKSGGVGMASYGGSAEFGVSFTPESEGPNVTISGGAQASAPDLSGPDLKLPKSLSLKAGATLPYRPPDPSVMPDAD